MIFITKEEQRMNMAFHVKSTLTGILNLQDDDSWRGSFLIEYSSWQGKEPTIGLAHKK
jgi:hypothetical protein